MSVANRADSDFPRTILFISSYVPGIVESLGRPDKSDIVGWPAIFHTINGFATAGWGVDWVILSEVVRKLPHIGGLNTRLVRVPLLRYLLGLWRRGRLWRISGLGALMLNTIWALSAAREIIRVKRPDLVYCFCESSALAGAILKAVFGIKVVTRILGAQSLCLGFWAGKNRLALLFQDPQYISQFLAPADLKVITNDGSVGKDIALLFRHISHSEIMCTYNGVDSPPMVALGDAGETLLIGITARLVAWKRVDALIVALSILKRKGLSVKLLVAGSGAEEPELRGLATDKCLSGAIEWLGQLKQTESIRRTGQCDIVVVAHKYCNLPNTLWEAMALGKCIIAVDDPGTRGTLVHMENAYLLKQDFTSDDLASAISFFYFNRDEIQRLGSNAKAWAAANLSSWRERVSTEISFIEKEVLHWC